MAESNIIESNSIDSNVHFFEGVEKLLEIWFVSNSPESDLRKIGR